MGDGSTVDETLEKLKGAVVELHRRLEELTDELTFGAKESKEDPEAHIIRESGAYRVKRSGGITTLEKVEGK